MKNLTAKTVCLYGLTIALVILGTIIIRIPLSATNGYIHLGDGFIMLFAFFFGRRNAAISGGIGSMLADIIAGYGFYAPFSLIIKALMGYIMGMLFLSDRNRSVFHPQNLFAILAGVLIMVAGYFFAGAILTGNFLASFTDVPANLVQGGGGICVYFIIGMALQKRHVALDKLR